MAVETRKTHGMGGIAKGPRAAPTMLRRRFETRVLKKWDTESVYTRTIVVEYSMLWKHI